MEKLTGGQKGVKISHFKPVSMREVQAPLFVRGVRVPEHGDAVPAVVGGNLGQKLDGLNAKPRAVKSIKKSWIPMHSMDPPHNPGEKNQHNTVGPFVMVKNNRCTLAFVYA